MSSQPPKGKSTGKRKFHLKSRNGCLTCKKRRVKCDETHPTCKKCANMGLKCGYTIDQISDANSTIHTSINGLVATEKPIEGLVLEKLPDLLPVEDNFSNPLLFLGDSPPKRRKLQSPGPGLENVATTQSTQKFSESTNNSQADMASSEHHPNSGGLTRDSVSMDQDNGADPAAQIASSASQAKPPNFASLLNAGNLNNLNVSHLINNLTGLNDLDMLGNLSLPNLAEVANTIDFESVFGMMSEGSGNQLKNAASAFLKAGEHLRDLNLTQGPTAQRSDTQGSATQGSATQGSATQGSVSQGNAAQTSTNPLQNLSQIPPLLSSKLASLLPQLSQMAPLQGAMNGAAQLSQKGKSRSKPAAILAAAAVTAMQPAEHSDTSNPDTQKQESSASESGSPSSNWGLDSQLNMNDLRLMFHYTSQVSSTITGAGISNTNIWNSDIPKLAFEFPFLMHSILAFSATHLSRTEKGLDQCVTAHRGNALKLLREAVLNINEENTDALVASALVLIMDALANASTPQSTSPKSLPASAWIFHVKGAATILTAVWPLSETSRFHKFISVDLSDLGDIINKRVDLNSSQNNFANLECHDSDISDLFPVEISSPYLITLAYLNKLHKERYKSDFILRIFAFPALLDKGFLGLLMMGDVKAMRIMRSYYKLLRSFTTEMKDKVWFLEGVLNILPVDVEEYAGGAGGMHMMLDFLGGGPEIVENEEIDERFEPNGQLSAKLTDPNNLPSDITGNLDLMGDNNSFLDLK